jgi:plasmid stability protein
MMKPWTCVNSIAHTLANVARDDAARAGPEIIPCRGIHHRATPSRLLSGALHSASIEVPMPTITVRNVPAKTVRALKALARRHNRSMEQEVRDLLEGCVAERRAVLDQIEAGWQEQARRPTAAEIDAWMAVGHR